jgi:hypothetical protein
MKTSKAARNSQIAAFSPPDRSTFTILRKNTCTRCPSIHSSRRQSTAGRWIAALALAHDCTPREIYEKRLNEAKTLWRFPGKQRFVSFNELRNSLVKPGWTHRCKRLAIPAWRLTLLDAAFFCIHHVHSQRQETAGHTLDEARFLDSVRNNLPAAAFFLPQG